MKLHTIKFFGRRSGAIGIHYSITTQIEAKDEDYALDAFLDAGEFETLRGLTVNGRKWRSCAFCTGFTINAYKASGGVVEGVACRDCSQESQECDQCGDKCGAAYCDECWNALKHGEDDYEDL